MAEGLIKKGPTGKEYVDEDDDRTIDKMIQALDDDTPDEDEEEILEAWLPKAFPDDIRQRVGTPMSVPQLEGELENQQFLKSDEVRGLNLKK